MQNLNLLLIEDNPADVFLIKEMLNPGGKGKHFISHAENLKDARELLIKNSFDFIISDLGLPDSYGLETIQFVLNQNQHLPIIVLTGNDNEQVGNDALSIGAQDYLIKGNFNSDQLLRSIRYAFRRNKAEVKLRESEEKFRTMIEISPNAVITLNPEGKILYASKRAIEVHGYKDKEQLAGINILDLFAKSERAKAKRQFQKIDATSNIRDKEFVMLRENGSKFYSELSMSVITGGNGDVDGYIVVTKDITERKNAENEIRLYQKNLQSLATELNMSEEKERRKIAVELHDHLGQSLAMAKIRLSALKSCDLSAFANENLVEIEKHISHSINYSRILTYELSPPVLFELGLIEAIKWKLDQLPENFGIKVKLDIRDKIPTLSDDFLILLFRSVSELINNVVKHSRAKNIIVTVFLNDHRLNITVKDDGNGFNPDILNKSIYKTNKIGLFSVQERLKYFEGNLNILSRKGKGAKINILVPVKN